MVSRRALALLAVTLIIGGAAVGCTEDAGTAKAFCKQVAKVPPLDTVVEGFASADPDELTGRLEGARQAYQALADAAPGDINGSTEALVDLVEAVIDGVAAHRTDPEAAADTIRAAVAERPDATEAAAEVAAYAKVRCDVDLNPVVAESSTTAVTAGAPTLETTPTSGGDA